jgi:hypothetical protein
MTAVVPDWSALQSMIAGDVITVRVTHVYDAVNVFGQIADYLGRRFLTSSLTIWVP